MNQLYAKNIYKPKNFVYERFKIVISFVQKILPTSQFKIIISLYFK